MSADIELKSYIDRVLRMKQEQDQLGQDIRDVYAEAKSAGFDKTIMGKLVAHLRKVLKEGDLAVSEQEDAFGTYLLAYNRASGTPLATHAHEGKYDPITGEVFESAASPKLIKTIVDGVQTEIGRKALTAVIDIMIENEEQASVGVPSPVAEPLAARGVEESAVSNSPETATEVPAQDGEGTGLGESLSGKSNTARPASVDAHVNDGRLAGQVSDEVVTVVGAESGTVAIPHSEAVATVATALPSAERVTPHRSGSAAASTGGEHVTLEPSANPHQAGALVGNHAPAINERCQSTVGCPFSHHPNKIVCSPCQKAWESRKVAVPA